MASKKFYADIATQSNVRITGDAVDTTNGGTIGSDKVITSGAVAAGLGSKAPLNGSAAQDFSTKNLTVNGDLTITGEINQQTVNNLQVDDREITLNNGGTLGTNTSGITIDGSGITTDAKIYYDGSDNTWYMKESDTSAVAIGTGTSNFDGQYSSLSGIPSTFAPSAHTHNAIDITAGTFDNARIAQGNVTQHEGALSIDWTQLNGVPGSFTPSAHNHSASEITSGSFADARVAASNVTQHQSSLEFANSLSFNTSNGILTMGRNVGADVTVDLDGRYLGNDDSISRIYTSTFTGVTSHQVAMPTAAMALNAIVQVVDQNFEIIDCQIDRTAGSANIDISFDTTLNGTVIINAATNSNSL